MKIIIDIPDNATNGDVIKALFPDSEFKVSSGFYYDDWKKNRVDYFYWNAPYKKRREQE